MLLTVAFFSSCQGDNQNLGTAEIIELNPTEAVDYINLSEIVDSVEYIRLKNENNEPMGSAIKVEVRDKYIYLTTIGPNVLFVFDKKGEFVAKLDREGRGPGEYLYIEGEFIDNDEKTVKVMCGDNVIVYENITFKHIRTDKVTEVASNDKAHAGDFYYHAPQQIPNVVNGKSTNAGLIITKNEEVVKTLFDKNIKTADENNHTHWDWPYIASLAHNNKNELFASIMYDNSFYLIKDTTATPVLNVDFGDYGIDNERIGQMPLYDQLSYFNDATNVASFPMLIMFNDDMTAFSYNFKTNSSNANDETKQFGDVHQYLKLKKSGKTFHTKRFKNDITDFPEYLGVAPSKYFMCTPLVDGKLVNVIVPELCLGDDQTEIMTQAVGKVTLEDAPIVVIMKLKQSS